MSHKIGGGYAIFHSGSLFTLFYMVVGCIIKQGLTKKLCFFYCLGGRPVSMQNFRFIVFTLFTSFYMIVACIIMYVSTLTKTGSKRVNDKLHNYALPSKKTGLLANIRVHWCYG